jgi:hypothetical protein
MTSRFSPLALAIVAFGAACADLAPTAPLADLTLLQAASTSSSASAITVMAQNLYVGADVDLVIGALQTPDPLDDQQALFFAIETLGKTAYPARAAAIADEIARTRPHAVGLQEVSVIDIDLSGLDGPVVHLDFLEILQAKLLERGLHYGVAASVRNIEAAPLPGISLVDYDALLVDADRVTVTSAAGQNFALNVPPFPSGLRLIRGWVWARVTIGGGRYTFVNTHTEADLAGNELDQLRAGQVSELVAFFAADERVVMMGDFNDEPGSLMYQVVTAAGFTDVWAALRPGVIGFTCCHLPNLSDRIAPFSQRIDYVFTRGIAGGGPGGRLIGQIDRFGEVPADRLAGPAYPIWPSDHAGMTATLR